MTANSSSTSSGSFTNCGRRLKPSVGGCEMSSSDYYLYDLFVSYTRADQAWVEANLLPSLDLPAERVITTHTFRPGASAVEEFERAVNNSRFTVLVLSPAYLADQLVRFSEQLASFAAVT